MPRRYNGADSVTESFADLMFFCVYGFGPMLAGNIIAIIVGTIIFLIAILMAVFAIKRKKYLSFANFHSVFQQSQAEVQDRIKPIPGLTKSIKNDSEEITIGCK